MAEALEGVARGRLIPMHCPVGLPRRQRERVLGAGSPLGWESQARGVGAENPLDTLAFDTQEYEFEVRLPELLLMRIDRFSMSNGVEARVPFLAPDLVDYVYRLPVDRKLAGGETKVVMRRAVADLVPDWVLARRNITTGELAYYRCFGPRGTRLRTLVATAGARWAVEESFQTAKNEAGLDQYQVRRYDAWYAHITLAMAAAAFLVITRAAEAVKGVPPQAVARTA